MEVSRSGKPPIMYGIRAALPSARAVAKAAAICCPPVTFVSAIEPSKGTQRLGQVLVTSAAKAHEVVFLRRTRSVSGGFGGTQQPCDRVCRLQRRDDPLQPRQLAEGTKRIGIADGLVPRAPAVAQLSVLG